jgi:hypothetical protein
MPGDKKTTASIPPWIAVTCILVLAIVLASTALTGHPRGSGDTFMVPDGGAPVLLPGTCPPALGQAPLTPVIPEDIAASTLILDLPPAEDRVPYTRRGFEEPVKAAVAWWMSPGFMDNTTEFRRWERGTNEGKRVYPEENRIFFEFIEKELDAAERGSVLHHDHTLFRGIHPGVAGMVLNTSAYHEPAFASTSYDISFSLDAFGVRSPDGYRNVLVMERGSGDHALYINEDEREYLLPRGTDWTVTRATNVENLTVVAAFPLHERTSGTAFFDHVRLISLQPAACM